LASNGTVTIGSTTSSYSYDPAKSNKNGRTLQYFSTKANEKMRHDEDETKPYYDDFSKFFLYYGNQFDYTDQIIQAAFDKSSVTLGSRTVDFTDFATDYVARSRKLYAKCLLCDNPL
jgi:hypothetical protein